MAKTDSSSVFRMYGESAAVVPVSAYLPPRSSPLSGPPFVYCSLDIYTKENALALARADVPAAAASVRARCRLAFSKRMWWTSAKWSSNAGLLSSPDRDL